MHAAAPSILILSIYRRLCMGWGLLFLCTQKVTSRADIASRSVSWQESCRLVERMAPKFFNPADFSGLSGPGAVPALDLVGICMVFACRLPARPACLGATCG